MVEAVVVRDSSPARTGPVLELSHASKAFNGVQALHDVSLTAHAGEVLALVGENGAGKSTLIKILSGAVRPDRGSVRVDGAEIGLGDPVAAASAGITAVYQEFNLQPHLTVAENLMFGDYPKSFGFIDWRRLRAEAAAFLADFGLEVAVDARVSQLSIADRQMLEIAKALRQNAKVLILDEPTAVLGGSDADRLMEKVRGLRDAGLATIFISHRLDEVFQIGDRYVVLKDGDKVGEGDVRDITPDHLVRLMVGRELSKVLHGRRRATVGEPVLEVESFSRTGVFEDISFTLHAGEILGVSGLRGAGRTELARAIVGADPHDRGTIRVSGAAVEIRSPADAARIGIGLLPEDRQREGLLLNLSVAENIGLARLASSGRLISTPARQRDAAEPYLDRLHIRVRDVGTSVRTLSGGNQQKVVVAKLLEAGVRILVLDEPTRGVDVGSKAELYEVMGRACDAGLAILLISSELPEVLAMSDRILVMHRGRVAGVVPGSSATEEEVMRYAVGGVGG